MSVMDVSNASAEGAADQSQSSSDAINDLLESFARISRSRVALEKSLKEKCMECIFKDADLLHGSENVRQKFTYLPPLLRRDFLQRLEVWAEDDSAQWTDKELHRVFSLVQLLLDQYISEFDFKVYRGNFQRDQDTWQLLAEKCPGLIRLVDQRPRAKPDPMEQDVMQSLLKLEALEHIRIQHHCCSDEDLAQLVEKFPGLRSLAVTLKFQQINYDLFEKLSKLQKLENLQIGLSGFTHKNYRSLAKHLTNELLYQCVLQLPALQEAEVFDHLDHQKAFVNSRQEVLDKPLALQSLRLKEGFQGWSCDMLPNVSRLHLQGPLRDVNEFLGFSNLTCLNVHSVSPEDIVNILQHCQTRLEDLSLNTVSETDHLDPYQLFFLCPNLNNLRWLGRVGSGRPDLFPVRAKNFKKLKQVVLMFETGSQPSELLFHILKAPHLEKLKISKLNLDESQMVQLFLRMRRGDVLQHLREFDVNTFNVADFILHALVPFLKIFPCFAPRLQVIRCRDVEDPDLQVLSDETCTLLTGLNIPGFKFEIYELS